MANYRDLEIWKIARDLSVAVHAMTLRELPKFEMYESDSQIRRSSKSIRSNIVEGYGRRRYKQEFIHFLTFALASCDETADHIETLHETGSLTNEETYKQLTAQVSTLGKKLNLFLQSIQRDHISEK